MLKKITFSLLFILGLNTIQAQSKPSPVGVQLYTFREQFAIDVEGTMKKVADMGIKYCETAGFYGKTASEFKTILDKNDIKAIGISAEFADLENPEKLKQIIADAKTLGAKTVVCFWIPHNGTDFTLEDTQKAIKVFNSSGKTLQANGLMFLYHAHGYEYRPYKDMYLMDLMIQKTNPLYVNYELDILWNYHPGQNPVQWLKRYPTRWKAMHVKDRRKGTPGNQYGTMDVDNDVTLGTGDINIEDIIPQAKLNKIKYYYLEDESARSMTQVPESIEYMRKWFK